MADQKLPIRLQRKKGGGLENAPARQTTGDVLRAAVGQVARSVAPVAMLSPFGIAALETNKRLQTSGGELPQVAQTKPQGAPGSKPALTTRPDAATVYNEGVAAFLQNLFGTGKPISVNALSRLAGAVPSPAAVPDIQDQIRANEYANLVATYQPILDAARESGDIDAYETAYQKFRQNMVPLIGVDPIQLQMANIDGAT